VAIRAAQLGPCAANQPRFCGGARRIQPKHEFLISPSDLMAQNQGETRALNSCGLNAYLADIPYEYSS
jgi:hypothetical protein